VVFVNTPRPVASRETVQLTGPAPSPLSWRMYMLRVPPWAIWGRVGFFCIRVVREVEGFIWEPWIEVMGQFCGNETDLEFHTDINVPNKFPPLVSSRRLNFVTSF